MIFSKNLLFKGTDKGEEIVKAIKNGTDIFNVFTICKAQNQNLFEILEISELFNEYYAKKNFKILGIAYKKENALILAKEIIENYYNKNGSLEGLKESL
ncbi:MAG: hypothetical protein LUH47_10360 [Clostridiales bacterium]|nr:hypothetical protein [Clostridiales bacterium]MCD8158097.1 hypothetical protein [Clostridiales bacterium]